MPVESVILKEARMRQQEDEEAYKRKIRFDLLAEMQPEKTMKLDDMGFSQIFAHLYRDELLFNATASSWFYYDGKKWREDVGSIRAAQNAREMSELLMVYGSRCIKDDKHREAFCKASAKYGGLHHRETIIKDARSLMAVRQEDFDAEDNLLNLQDCTLDLDTLQVHAHRSSDMLTKIANVNYSPCEDGEAWATFMEEVMQGDYEKIDYLQRICGLCLTADTSLECCFFLYGATTRNGKSTFVETISAMLGDYAATAQPETLAQHKNKGSSASSDVARLNGCRFLNVSEPPKRMLLDVALLKQLTGGDTITARKLYQNEFEFKPKFKLMLNTNSLPNVTDSTLFTSDRVRIITFDRHFEPHEQNPRLKQELTARANLSALLNWCIEGLKNYRKTGEKPPKSVLMATEQYKNESDKIAVFFGDCMKRSDFNSSGADVYSCFCRWCDDSGLGKESKTNFFSLLRERNLLSAIGTVNGKTVHNVVVGYSVIPIWEE